MNISRVVVHRPIMTSMFVIVFLIFGGMSYFNLSLNQMPDIEIPYVVVQTIYPGAGPKEVEIQVTKQIENAVATVSNIKTLQSFSLENVSIIMIEFDRGEDINIKNIEVKDKVDGIINNLPEEIYKPVIQKIDIQAVPTVDFILKGDASSIELYDVAENMLQDRLSQVEGVANVTLIGGAEREIQLILNNMTVFENSISLAQLTQIIAASNMDLPAGSFDLDGQKYSVRTKGEFTSIEQISEIEIPTAFGVKKFGQIGSVADASKREETRTILYNTKTNVRNENTVLLSVIKSPEGNVVKVADALYELLPELRKEIPSNMAIEIVQDRSTFIRDSVNDTLNNIIMGVIFTAIMLLVFIGDLRSTFIVALAMPISIISTFWLIDIAGFSLNMMTLMGISATVGVLVANSIVVIENIFRHKELGLNKKESAAVGTSEVALAVVASTATNLVVFIPLASMKSMMGAFLAEFAWTVVFATIFSLVVSFTVTPMLSGIILPRKFRPGKFNRFVHQIIGKWESGYGKMLAFILKSKRTALVSAASSIVALVIVIIIAMPYLAFEMMPEMDQGFISVNVELPEGYSLDETGKLTFEIEKRLAKYPEVERITTTLGRTSNTNRSSNLAQMMIKLVDINERDRRVQELVPRFIFDVSDIPNAKLIVAASAGENRGPGAGLEFSLLGNNLDTLERYKTIIVDRLKDIPGLINFDNTSRQGAPEITISPDRDKIAEVGITVAEIAIAVRGAVEGLIANKYREQGNEYDITITLSDLSYNTPEKISNIAITSSRGQTFRLAQLAQIDFTRGYTQILHKSKYPSITFTGTPATGYVLGQIQNEVDKRLAEIDFPDGYKIDLGGGSKQMKEVVDEMLIAVILAIILTYMLLAALLEHLVQPLIILSTLPLALIGVLLALLFTGKSLSMIALLAIIMLIGVVVNNAILILDYSNQLIRDEGLTHQQALIKASPVKLRPILMSTGAIILGMLPMAMGWGDQGAEMRQPMGIVQIGGLLASTVLCLFVVPSLDYLVDEFYQFLKRLLKIKSQAEKLAESDGKNRY